MSGRAFADQTRWRVAELVSATRLDHDRIAFVLGLKRETVEAVVAADGLVRRVPALAELVEAVRDHPAGPEERAEALAACLWALASRAAREQTGRDPDERAPDLAPGELRRLVRAAITLEASVAQARAALLRREAEGDAAHDPDAGSLADLRAELARRVAAAHRAAHDAGLAAGPAGAAPAPPRA
jgi:hypothetical protein